MAVEIPGKVVGILVAAADLRTKQFYCVKVDSAAKIALCSAAGESVFGVLQNDPNTGEAAAVMTTGVTKAVAGAALAAGAYVTTDANGKLKAVVLGRTDTSDAGAAADALLGSNVLGQLLEASTADGDIVTLSLGARAPQVTTAS